MANHSPRALWWRRHLHYPLQSAFAHGLFALFGALPAAWASALGGAIGRTIGPRLAASRKARTNLERALPELPPARRQEILLGMWDNLGRVMGEYPHLLRLGRCGPGDAVELVGREHLETQLASGKPVILVAGHLANWELLGVTARTLGLDLTLVYRAPNNAGVDRLLQRARGATPGRMVPKGASGAATLIRTVRSGRHVGILVDQKMNDGIPVPFFGRPAMTAPAVATLARRYGARVLPTRVERLGGTPDGPRFRITVLAPLEYSKSSNAAADELELMTRINQQLEGWIRERPEQWLWLHRRWND